MTKLGEGLKIKYEPIYPQAPVDMTFHYYETNEAGEQVLKIHEENFKLISSIEELEEYIEKCKDKIIAFDTETTGLTYVKDHIVGFSISLDSYSGIYVPIRHQIRKSFKEKVDKLDENGNQILTKSGRVSTMTKVSYEYEDCAENLNPKEALDVLYKILLGAKLVLMHNSEFDLNMLKFEGYDPIAIKSFDTLILPYLYDPEATALAGLKALEKRVLGRTVPEFKDVLGKEHENFAFVAPKDGYLYACYDTAGTLGVYQKMKPAVQELLDNFKQPLVFDGVPYRVMAKDNQMVKAFVDYYGHAKILIDKDKAKQYQEQLIERQKKVAQEIYSYFDRGAFNLQSNSKEFQAAMADKKIYTGVLSDKGSPSFSKKAADEMKRNLNKIKEGMLHWKEIDFNNGKLSKKGALAFNFASALALYGKYYFKIKSTVDSLILTGLKKEPMDKVLFWKTVKHMYITEMKKAEILGLIHTNNSLNKALNSYVEKLTQVDECYMRYRLKGTKSGRLSSGNGSKSDKKRNMYYIDLNAQNLTKPASAYYKAEECSLEDEEGILGWKFTPLETNYAMEHLEDLYIVEGQDPAITIRGCLKAPEGRYVVSLDYDAEEYKLMAVLSRDSLMLSNFYNGIDPHTASAYAIWGEENYNKAKRKKAKIFNFLNNYSGGAYTLSQALDIPQTEAQSMIDSYNAKFHEMVAWKEKEINEMYQNGGVVYNAFGRPRQFKGWINVIDKNRDNYTTLLEKEDAEKASWRVQSAVERRVASHLIQGTAGDILRLVMLNLYKRYFKNRDPHIDFLSTVHDEINYTIDKELTVQYVRELEQIMTFDTLDKTLPITTSTDIGYTYGNMFPFVWENEETKERLIPKRVHHA